MKNYRKLDKKKFITKHTSYSEKFYDHITFTIR